MTEKKLKGGRKGGATFPRLDLKQAVSYAKKLVSKTHTGPQPQNVIYPGVFGVTSHRGVPKASALKQYKLMKGNSTAYQATDLARKISVAPKEEIKDLLVESFMHVKIFKTTFDTFKGDEIPKSKIKQQAASLNVHPDSLEEFNKIFSNSCVYAGIATINGDILSLVLDPSNGKIESKEDVDPNEGQENDGFEYDENNDDTIDVANLDDDTAEKIGFQKDDDISGNLKTKNHKADIQIKIDPSMDPEKLEKLLAVLKKYGQL